MRLQHVSLPMPHGRLDEARAFYCEVLGLPEKPVPESLGGGLLWLDAGGDREVHLFPDDAAAHPRQHFALVVADLDAARTRLIDAGATVTDATPIPGRRPASSRRTRSATVSS